MALVTCPECHAKVSSFAISCPHCGYPIQKNIEIVEAYEKSKKGEKGKRVEEETYVGEEDPSRYVARFVDDKRSKTQDCRKNQTSQDGNTTSKDNAMGILEYLDVIEKALLSSRGERAENTSINHDSYDDFWHEKRLMEDDLIETSLMNEYYDDLDD